MKTTITLLSFAFLLIVGKLNASVPVFSGVVFQVGSETLSSIPVGPFGYDYGDRSALYYHEGRGYLMLAAEGLYTFEGLLGAGTLVQEIAVGTSATVPARLSLAGETLYLRKRWPNLPPSCSTIEGVPEYFFVSTDLGETWDNITDQFWFADEEHSCGGLYRVPWSGVVQEGGQIYANPSRWVNFFRHDEGEQWVNLLGEKAFDEGIGPEWNMLNGAVVWGGKILTPIETSVVELWRAVLTEDGTGWETEPYLVDSADGVSGNELLTDRDFLTVAANKATDTFLIGLEGGILRSDDHGETFDFVLRYPRFYGTWAGNGDSEEIGIGVGPEDTASVPYIHTFLFPSQNPNYILAGGKDYGADDFSSNTPVWLGWSSDNGETWKNITHLVAQYGGTEDGDIVFLSEDPNGRILVGMLSVEAFGRQLIVIELELPSKALEFDANAIQYSDGWLFSPKAHWVWGEAFPWIWSHALGSWFWCEGSLQEGVWLWSEALGWIWSQEEVFPSYWSIDDNEWGIFLGLVPQISNQ